MKIEPIAMPDAKPWVKRHPSLARLYLISGAVVLPPIVPFIVIKNNWENIAGSFRREFSGFTELCSYAVRPWDFKE